MKVLIIGKHTSDGGIIWHPTQKQKYASERYQANER